MSSAQATGVLSPSPRSPLMNVNWGVRRHGLEEFPPTLGVDEFAVVNPDFWSGTPEEQRAFQGWYRFSDVSSLCYSLVIRSNVLAFVVDQLYPAGSRPQASLACGLFPP